MTEQEALKDIIGSGIELGAGDFVNIKSLKIAVKALEKQIPKKPDYEGDGYDDNGNLIYDTWICPCCRTEYELDYDDYKFCPNCGQKIDWSECNEI